MTLKDQVDKHDRVRFDLVSQGLDADSASALVDIKQDPNVKAALVLQAFGVPAGMVEEALDITPDRLASAKLIPELKEFYSSWSIRIKSGDADAALSRLVPVAIYAQESILTDEEAPAALRLKVAENVIDRVKGKAKQSLEVTSSKSSTALAKEAQLTEDLESVMSTIKKLEAERAVILNAKEVTAV